MHEYTEIGEKKEDHYTVTYTTLKGSLEAVAGFTGSYALHQNKGKCNQVDYEVNKWIKE